VALLSGWPPKTAVLHSGKHELISIGLTSAATTRAQEILKTASLF
jgi:hypothetical protein